MHRFSDRLLGIYFAPDDPPPGAPPADPAAPPADPATPKTFDEAYVKSLREENASHRTRATAAEKRLKELEDAKLSDTEKLQKRAEEAEKSVSAAKTRIARAEVKVAAVDAKIIDPDAAYRLIKDDIEFDADGEPKNVADLLKKLVTDKPYLVGDGRSVEDPSSPGAPGNRRAGGGQTFTRSQIADRAFYTANEAAIHRAFAEGRITEG